MHVFLLVSDIWQITGLSIAVVLMARAAFVMKKARDIWRK